MFSFLQLLDIEVKEENSGKGSGAVGKIILDPKKKKVEGFLIKPKNVLKKEWFLPLEDVTGIEEKVLYCKSQKGVSNDEKEDDCKKETEKNSDLLAKEVMTKDGNRIGRIYDVLFREKTGTLEAFLLSDGLFHDLLSGRKKVTLNIYYSILEDQVLLKQYDPYVEETYGGLIQKIEEKRNRK